MPGPMSVFDRSAEGAEILAAGLEQPVEVVVELPVESRSPGREILLVTPVELEAGETAQELVALEIVVVAAGQQIGIGHIEVAVPLELGAQVDVEIPGLFR